MGHSSLVGIDRIPTTAPGHDSDALGPSDSSDSGSDVAGLMQPDDGGPDAPVDRATDPDIERPDTSTETVGPGVDSDSHGTGERRSAGGDAGRREAADISPDRIVSDPNSTDMLDDPSDGLVERDDDERAADAAALRAAESIDDGGRGRRGGGRGCRSGRRSECSARGAGAHKASQGRRRRRRHGARSTALSGRSRLAWREPSAPGNSSHKWVGRTVSGYPRPTVHPSPPSGIPPLLLQEGSP